MSQAPLHATRVHSRQFVLDRREHRIGPGWASLDVGGGYVLSHCPELNVQDAAGLGGARRVLVGHAFQAMPEAPAAEESLAGDGDLVEESFGWAGRWVVIADGLVFGDASNLLGLFYERGEDGFLVSSSLAIVAALRPGRARVERRFNRCGMNWTPPPTTKLAGVQKLLPDQAIDLRADAVRQVSKLPSVHGPSLDAPAAGRLLLDALERVWRGLAASFPRIRLTLTSGLDSRTLMAAGLSSGIRFDAVTLEHGRMSLADRTLPAEICARSGVAHRFVPLARRRPGLDRVYDDHTLRDVNEADREFWRRGMFDWAEHGDCVVRGAAFGLGRFHLDSVFRGLTWDDVAADPARLARRFGDFTSVALEAAQLRAWVDWRARHPGPHGWIRSFHHDQKLCGWAAAGEQGLDLLRGTSINPANCGYVLDLLQRSTHEPRGGGAYQLECVRQSGTGLDRWPTNPILEGPFTRAASRLRHVAKRALNEGANLVGI
jgi:hypothetical protein